MARRASAIVAILGLLLAFVWASGAGAAELKVYPLRLALSPKEPVSAMNIHNGGTDPVLLQLQVFSWRQQADEDVLEPTREVLVNPGVFQLPPGADQIARFGLRTTMGAMEQSYRVIAQQVPIGLARKPGEVVTLLRISVPIFVTPPGARARLTWRITPAGKNKISVDVRNDGTSHMQITHMAVTREDRQPVTDQNLSLYVLPNAWRRVTLDTHVPVVAGQLMQILATTDQEPVSAVVTSEVEHDERNGR